MPRWTPRKWLKPSIEHSVSTAQGLRVRAEIDEKTYDAGIKVTDEELATVSIERDEFHGEWNYRIRTRQTKHVARRKCSSYCC